jgi:hypothetical protein
VLPIEQEQEVQSQQGTGRFLRFRRILIHARLLRRALHIASITWMWRCLNLAQEIESGLEGNRFGVDAHIGDAAPDDLIRHSWGEYGITCMHRTGHAARIPV